MDIFTFIDSYKALIGTSSIAIATLATVFFNLRYSKHEDRRRSKFKQGSLASALSAELIDNSQNLIELYLEIESPESRSHKISFFKHFDLIVYQTLLQNVGDFGSSLSFLLVDIYGDIKKLKARLDFLNTEEILADREDLLPEIQNIIIKSLTGGIVMLFYADYLSGKDFMKMVRERRIFWVEKNLNEYCQYVAKIDNSLEFVSVEDDQEKEFFKRFNSPEDKSKMKDLFEELEKTLSTLPQKRSWEAATNLRALSYKFMNALNYFIDNEPTEYELIAEGWKV